MHGVYLQFISEHIYMFWHFINLHSCGERCFSLCEITVAVHPSNQQKLGVWSTAKTINLYADFRGALVGEQCCLTFDNSAIMLAGLHSLCKVIQDDFVIGYFMVSQTHTHVNYWRDSAQLFAACTRGACLEGEQEGPTALRNVGPGYSFNVTWTFVMNQRWV